MKISVVLQGIYMIKMTKIINEGINLIYSLDVKN